MNPPRRGVKLPMVLLLGFVTLAASVPRFGERENDALRNSDSDYYLDMARFFSGEQERPDPRYADPSRSGSHHYIRGLLPFLAGKLGRVLGGDYRTAFSLLNVLAAWLIAVLIYQLVASRWPNFDHPWAPGLLFLVSFPQMNWGYNILTDTFGYATTLAATLAAAHVVDQHEQTRPSLSRRGKAAWLTLTFVLQSLAFLTRQTAWITLIAVAFVLVSRGTWRRNPIFALGLLATLVIAKAPHSLYVAWLGLQGLEIPVRPALIFDPRYLADTLVKSGVAFHLAWIPAFLVLARKGFSTVPDVVVGWSVGAILYMAAGFLHNSYDGVSYPLRLTFALFPLVLPLAATFFETRPWHRPRLVLVTFGVAYTAISLLGVFLDPGRGRIRILDILAVI